MSDENDKEGLHIKGIKDVSVHCAFPQKEEARISAEVSYYFSEVGATVGAVQVKFHMENKDQTFSEFRTAAIRTANKIISELAVAAPTRS